MIHIRHRLAAVVCAGLLAPIAVSTATGAAIDQDLVVSAASGAPGDVIDVSSASCPPPGDEADVDDRYLRVLLISDGSEAVLAGAGSGYGSASFIVPDWADPADPAVIEASCITETFDGDFQQSAEAYDPVAFDILPGAGAPTQGATPSRTSLLVGQSFAVTGTGCPSGAVDGGTDLIAGSDLSGRSFGGYAASGFGEVEAGALDSRVDLIEWSYGYGWSSTEDGRPTDIELHQGDTQIAPGTYAAISYCGTYDDATDQATYLVLPPSLIEITGDAPIDDLSMDVAADTPDGTLVGGSCTAGDVEGEIGGTDLVAAGQEMDGVRVGTDRKRSPLAPARTAPASASGRAVGHRDWVPFTATPSADGAWEAHETATFDVGVLIGEATCGDPLADGFFYDIRLGVVDVPEPTTTTTTTTTAPAPAPADAVSGQPTYAG